MTKGSIGQKRSIYSCPPMTKGCIGQSYQTLSYTSFCHGQAAVDTAFLLGGGQSTFLNDKNNIREV